MHRLGKEINKPIQDVRVLKSDNGTEFKNTFITTFCNKTSIIQRFSTPYFPSENGKIERAIRTVKTVMRNILITARLSISFWCMAAYYAVNIINVLPKKGNKKSPFELFMQKKPQMKRFFIFGAPGIALDNNKAQGLKRSLFKRAEKIKFMGFSSNSKMYRVWNIKKQKFEEFRDIKLNEEYIIRKQQERFEHDTHPTITKRYNMTDQAREISLELKLIDEVDDKMPLYHPGKVQKETLSGINADDDDIVQEHHLESEESEEANHPDQADLASDVAIADVPNSHTAQLIGPTYCEIDANNIIEHKRARQAKIPRSYYELLQSPDKSEWQVAFDNEVCSLETVGGMRVTQRPSNELIIPTRTLFSEKFNTFTNKTEKKVRIVARGDIQKEYIQPGEPRKFSAPVASKVTLRLFLMTAQAHEALEQLDIKTAFLYGRLRTGKFFELPHGHPQRKGKQLVWFSETALYGLLEGANAWYFTIADTMLKLGCTQSLADPCLFFFREGKDMLDILIYVDDILVAGAMRLVQWIKKELMKEFKIKTKTDINKYVGLDLVKHNDYFLINHKEKIVATIESWELTEAKAVAYPIEDTSLKNEEIMKEKEKYQSVIGSLNYFAHGSRPDAAYATNFLARRVQQPSRRLFKQAKNLLVYLRDTVEEGIKIFPIKKTHNVIRMYVDASFGGEIDRHSVFGFLLYLNNSLIHFRSKKLPLIVLSSTEAEYVGMCKAVQEMLWVKNILQEMKVPIQETIILCDSQPAIKMINRPGISGRTKHLDLKLQFVKQRANKGEFNIEYVSTDKNLADILTKSLRGNKFKQLRDNLFNVHFDEEVKMREGVNVYTEDRQKLNKVYS